MALQVKSRARRRGGDGGEAAHVHVSQNWEQRSGGLQQEDDKRGGHDHCGYSHHITILRADAGAGGLDDAKW